MGKWFRRQQNHSSKIPVGPLKLICVVDTSLKMGKGKIAAQVGHACMEVALFLNKSNPAMLKAWRLRGSSKVVVRLEENSDFIALSESAKKLGINTHTVRDAGHTQVNPGTHTVLAIGPASEELLESITNHLRLL